MQAKVNGWKFPRIRCRSNWTGRFCCAGIAAVEDVYRDDDGRVFGAAYRCEFGHGWTMFVDNGQLRDLDTDHVVQDDRTILDRWACRQCTDDRGQPKLVIWPVSTEVCPHCRQGTRYDCLDCGNQLRADETVYEEGDGFMCDACWMDQHTVPASKVHP